MGILGLTSFMNSEVLNQVLEKINLNSSTILIDGYSLLYKVFSLNCIQSVHGGNYDELASSLSEIFLSLKKCNINAIFLLDGGKDKSDRKIKTNIKRISQRINNAISVTNSGKKNTKIDITNLINSKFHMFPNLLPILSFQIYLDLLKKFEIQHFQCTFEADYDLACLANELKCPLVSCDSDFYVYDLAYGYIPFDYFYFSSVATNQTTNDSYIPAYIFKIDKFVQHINKNLIEKKCFFKKEMLPIFAVICGNDYVDKSVFNSLINSFDSSNNNLTNKRIGKTPKSYIKNKNNFYLKIIRWLSHFESPTECVNVLLGFIKSNNHELVKNVIEDSIKEYLCKKPSLVKYFRSQICQDLESKLDNLDLNELAMEITSFNGSLVNDLFIKKFIHFQTTRLCLEVLIHRRTMFNCQIEISEWPSCYISSTFIRKFYYTMLFKIYEHKSLTQEAVIITEYIRYKNLLSTFVVNLSEDNEIFLSADPVTVDNKFIFKNLFKTNDSILLNLLQDKFKEKKMNEKIKNLFVIIYYWLNTEKINEDYTILHDYKNGNFIRAFIISILKSAIIDPVYSLIKNKIEIPDKNAETLIKFENNDNSLINNFLSNDENSSSDVFDKVRQFLSSDKNNFSYLKEIRIKLKKFSTVMTQNTIQTNIASKNQRFMNAKLVHCLSEFQAVYLSTWYVSTIFKSLETIKLNNFFNGTFLHNFKQELDHKIKPDYFIEEFFGRQSFFNYLYKEFLSYFTEVFDIKENFLKSNSKHDEEVHVN